MSEYQYYDFYSIDRALNREELETIRTFSSRVHATPRRATFEYNFGDFRYDELEVLNDFFDIMLYVANWGSRRLAMKFPASLVSHKVLRTYDIDAGYDYTNEIRVLRNGPNIIVDMYCSLEDGDWVEGEGMLDQLLPLRAQILGGDHRALYLAWLHLAYEYPDIEEEWLVPITPANLKNLDHALECFVGFWEMDGDLVRAVSETSKEEAIVSDEMLQALVESLTDKEKNQFLSTLVTNGVQAKNQLRKRLMELNGKVGNSSDKVSFTLGELREATARYREERIQQEKMQAEREYQEKLERIKRDEVSMWEEIAESAEQKNANGYMRAVSLLKELKEFYDFHDRQIVFHDMLRQVLEKYGKSIALRRRMKENGIF
ncbi:MAG: hypothetical protein AAGA10_07950 [Bacteroidota bacterium]